MKNILLPIDFSANSLHAFNYAYNLYGGQVSTYYLVYAYAAPVMASEMAYTPVDRYKEDAEIKMKDMLDVINEEYPGTSLKTIIEFGDLPTVIKRLEKNDPFDVIVMGTTGSSGMREFFFGSNAYDVVDNTELPVIVVPADASLRAPERIMLCSDLKPLGRIDLFDELRNIAIRFSSEITILNVKTDADTFTVNEQMNYYDEELDGILTQMCFDDSDDVVRGIEKCAKDFRSDLLVAVKRKKGFLKDLFGHSVTREITFHEHLPMLILHD